jgi:hypothetical protein
MTERRAPRDPYADPRRPRHDDPGYEPDAGYELDGYEPEERGRRISPVVVFLIVAVIGSILYMAYVVTVREATQIPLLASGAVVLAIVFAALATYCLRSVWSAGTEVGRGGRTMLTALVGGVAAVAAAGFAAGAIILFQIASWSA